VTSAEPQLRRWTALGAAGSVILAISALLGAGAMPRTGEFWPGIPVLRHAPGLTTAGAYLGLALLIGAWLGLGRLLAAATPGYLVRTLLYWAAPLVLTVPMWSRDAYSYAAQGALLLHGFDPYRDGAAALGGDLAANVPPVWLHTPAPYGPVFVLASAAVMWLSGGHGVLALLGMRLLALLGVTLIVVYLPRLARLTGHSPVGALWLAVLNPLLLASFVAGAHNDALMVGLMVAGVALALGGRVVPGAVLITLAALVKAPAAAALLFVLPAVADRLVEQFSGRLSRPLGSGPGRLRRVSALGVAAGLLGAVAALTTVVVTAASRVGYGWIDVVLHPVSVRNGMSISTDLGIWIGRPGEALGLFTEDGTVAATRTLGQLVALAVCGWALWRVRRLGVAYALGLAFTALVVLAAVVHPWYLLWGFVPLAAAPLHPRLRQFVIAVSVLLCLVVPPSGGDRSTASTVGSLAGLAVGLAVLTLPGLLARRLRGQPREVPQRQVVPVHAQAGDDAGSNGGDH